MLIKVFLITIIFLVCLNTANGDTVEFRARNTETLAIFAYPQSDDGIKDLYSNVDYFCKLISIWDVEKSIVDYNNLPLQLFFGERYNATSFIEYADSENYTAGLFVALNNQEYLENITIESSIPGFTTTTKCDKSPLCKITQRFLKTPRDPLTKLNLIYISNICPDGSLFKEFYEFGQKSGYKTTKTYLISDAVTANNEACKSNNKYLNHQYFFSSNTGNYSFKADTQILVDPRFEFDGKYADSSIFVTINNETEYNTAIKSIGEYYSNNPLNYLITLTVENIAGLKASKQITTIIPKVDYTSSSFTVEEYLKQNFDYLLERNEMSTKRAVLAAKDCRLLSNQNQSSFGSSSLNGIRNGDQYNSINLNKFGATKILHSSDSTINSSSKSIQNINAYKDPKGFVNDYETNKNVSWQKNNNLFETTLRHQNYLQKDNTKWHTKNASENLNKSTLSYHIEAYENDVIESRSNSTKVGNDLKASKTDKFGFPRQQQKQQEKLMEAEMMAFKLSKPLLNISGMKATNMSLKATRISRYFKFAPRHLFNKYPEQFIMYCTFGLAGLMAFIYKFWKYDGEGAKPWYRSRYEVVRPNDRRALEWRSPEEYPPPYLTNRDNVSYGTTKADYGY